MSPGFKASLCVSAILAFMALCFVAPRVALVLAAAVLVGAVVLVWFALRDMFRSQ